MKEEGKRRGEFFWNLREGWASEKKKITHLNVWFGLNGLGSSQNSLIHNWCIGGCWFTKAHKLERSTGAAALHKSWS